MKPLLLSVWLSIAACHRESPLVQWLCYVFPPHRLFDFATGVCCGIAFLKGSERGHFQWGFRLATCLEVAAVGFLGVLVLSSPSVPAGLRFGPYYTPAMAMLILVLAADRGAVSRALRARPLLVLGEASYAIYLLHWPIMLSDNRFRASLGFAEAPRWSCCLVVAGATLVCSIFVHYAFERPMRTLIRRWLGTRRPATAPREELEAGTVPMDTGAPKIEYPSAA